MTSDQQPAARGPMPPLDNLLIDRNRDGFPDDIVGVFAIPEDLDRQTWEAVLNLAARLGLASSGLTPPIVAREPLLGRVSITVRPGDADRLNTLIYGDVEPGEPVEATPVPGHEIDLADPWSIKGFLLDRDDDHAADDSAIHLTLPEQIPFQVGAALAEFAARVGIECGGLTFPIAGSTPLPFRRTLSIEINTARETLLRSDPDGTLALSGDADALENALRHLAAVSSGFLSDRPGKRAVEWLRRSAAGWTYDGRAAQLRASLENARADRVVILDTAPGIQRRLQTTVTELKPAVRIDRASPVESIVFDHQWTAEWEVVRLMRSLEQDILPKLDPGSPVDLTLMTSEPPQVRRRVRGQVSRLMLQHGFTEGSLHVLDAFKPGLSWLSEVILPKLRRLGYVDQINIQAKHWDPEHHEGQLDMPIRWLQELFPADEIMASAFDLPLNQVTISLTEQGPIYQVTATDRDGQTVLDESFSPFWRRIDYLAGFREAGNVTITTGGILAAQPGNTFRSHVLTDPEVFWRYLQGEMLPALRRFILRLTGGEPQSATQPFFDDLFVDVRISASDHPYGIREERHSAAEALHEDIYFNMLDFVEELGQKTTGEKLDAPGSVRPFVTVTPGRQPEARIRLTRRPEGIARLIADREIQTVKPAASTLPDRPDVRALSFDDKRLTVHVDRSTETGFSSDFLHALAKECSPTESNTILRIEKEDGHIEIGVPEPRSLDTATEIAPTPIPDDTIISNPEIYPHLNRLARHPAVTFVPAAEISWQGRSIPAVAVTSPQEAGIWSMRKLAHFKPTKLIVARHHANEVASTTSALQMIEALTADNTGSAMLRGLNVIFLPLENPDGAALHDALRRVNPTWKHHPARYNATGYEFGEDQGNSNSQYGEGRVRDLVWAECLPDIVVDNHGVPSHEWAQLFAGFGSPPRFGVSYWQVQSLLYGILPYLDQPPHRAAFEAVRDCVAREIAVDDDLLQWNRIYTERYRTWGHQWVPERFPLELHQEMLFHIRPVDPESIRGRRSYSVRHPNTTVLNWITEVCDETVEGEELQRTARAHFLANKAVMELLRDHAGPYRAVAESVAGGVKVRTGRQRPIEISPRH